MKKLFIVCALTGLIVLAGCTSISPGTATSNPVGSKVGESSVNYLFGIIPLSNPADMSIQKAARNGGITKISVVDVKYGWYYFWVTKTTIVNGE